MAEQKKSDDGGGCLVLFLLIIAGLGWMLWVGGSRAWDKMRGVVVDGPVHVRCHMGDQTVYEGIARDGLSERGGRLVLTDPEGREVTISANAVCVTAKGRPKTTAR